ncbi:MAG TPA: hypothetical protein VNV66_06330 [Pilimelia sp.]|nr:hypothetical protein [Pilimelia sp.]
MARHRRHRARRGARAEDPGVDGWSPSTGSTTAWPWPTPSTPRRSTFDAEDPVAVIEKLTGGTVDPALLLTAHEPMSDVLEAYREFDRREPGWIRVALNPGG